MKRFEEATNIGPECNISVHFYSKMFFHFISFYQSLDFYLPIYIPFLDSLQCSGQQVIGEVLFLFFYLLS